jgi:hypothetical protein
MCMLAASTVTLWGNEWRVMTHTAVYRTQRWRNLPRDYCLISELLGDFAGPCRGLISHHHIDPSDPDSRTAQVCNAHHSQLHGVLRKLERRRRCPHRHPTREGREACERSLNRSL